MTMQAKLLRVLQERDFERVGGTHIHRRRRPHRRRHQSRSRRRSRAPAASARISTIRLNVFPVHVPATARAPRRHPPLVAHFAEKYGERSPARSPASTAKPRSPASPQLARQRPRTRKHHRARRHPRRRRQHPRRRLAATRTQTQRCGITRRHAPRSLQLGRLPRRSHQPRRQPRRKSHARKHPPRMHLEQNSRRRKTRRLPQNPPNQAPRRRPRRLTSPAQAIAFATIHAPAFHAPSQPSRHRPDRSFRAEQADAFSSTSLLRSCRLVQQRNLSSIYRASHVWFSCQPTAKTQNRLVRNKRRNPTGLKNITSIALRLLQRPTTPLRHNLPRILIQGPRLRNTILTPFAPADQPPAKP